MAYIEIIRGHWDEAKNGAAVWLGEDEKAHNEWVNGDPDTPRDKPDPSFVIEADVVDRFVIQWLRGPMGPPGPTGAPGMSA